MTGDPEVLKTQETAILLSVQVEPVRQLVRRKAIPSFKVGRDWRFRKAALVRWEDEAPDLILLDLVMPEMNGIQFLELLREAHPYLPVVIVTGYPDSELASVAVGGMP